MERMQFPQSWISVVMDCISTSRLFPLLNGKPVGQVIPSRGLRQGCPLSPYLFLLVSKAFSNLIVNSERNGRELGIRSCKDNPLISHLFFTDDSMLFSKASRASGKSIRRILMVMRRAQVKKLILINLSSLSVRWSPFLL